MYSWEKSNKPSDSINHRAICLPATQLSASSKEHCPMELISELVSFEGKTLVKLCAENVKLHAMNAYHRAVVQLYISSTSTPDKGE